MMPDGSYRSAREGAVSDLQLVDPPKLMSQTLYAHPSSVMFTRQPSTGWVIFTDVLETSKSFMRDLTVIEEEWLVELA